MIVECPVCHRSVSEDAAVRVGEGAGARLFCSARCAGDAKPEAGLELAPLPEAPRRILAAVDGSGPSLRAVQMAARLASLSGGEVRLFHAVESGWMRPLSLAGAEEAAVESGLPEEVARALRDDAEALLERCARICARVGVTARTHVEFGAPLQGLMERARDADLIVMGSRGLGTLATTFVGSLSQRVIAGAAAPVLVVH